MCKNNYTLCSDNPSNWEVKEILSASHPSNKNWLARSILYLFFVYFSQYMQSLSNVTPTAGVTM